MYGTELWAKIRPWVWPSAEDLATLMPPPKLPSAYIPQFVAEISADTAKIHERLDAYDGSLSHLWAQVEEIKLRAQQPASTIEPSAFYITQASKAFLEHMADHRAQVDQAWVNHTQFMEQRMEALERELDGLRHEVVATQARLERALARLRGLGED